MKVSVQLHAPVSLLAGKEPHTTHWIRGWMGLRAGLVVAEKRKILLLPGKEPHPSTPQPIGIPTEVTRLIKRK
jgi:hypothetical protein